MSTLDELNNWKTTKTEKVLIPKKKAPKKKVLSKVLIEKPEKPTKEEKKLQKFIGNLNGVVDESEDDEDVDIEEQIKIGALTKKAELIIKQEKAKQDKMKTAVMRGQLLKDDLFFSSITPFIDRLMSDLQRMGSSYLTDISKQIINEGALTPAIRAKWEDMILEKQDDAVNESIELLEEIKKEQAEK